MNDDRTSDEILVKSGVELIATDDKRELLIPAMTAEEVARGLASRGKKMVKIEPPPGVSNWEFMQIISAAFMTFMRDGGQLPDAKKVAQSLEFMRVGRVEEIMRSPQFRHAMFVRGVDFSGQTRLTPEQDMAILIMSAPSNLTFEKKLRAAGVAPSKWRAWLKNKAFRQIWDSIGGSLLVDHETDMMVALIGRAVDGDVPAIKYAFEVSDRYNPGKQKQVDAEILVQRLIEIVQEEVKDIEVLTRIAARMSMVANSNAKVIEHRQILGAEGQ